MTFEDAIAGLGRSMLRFGAAAGVRVQVNPRVPLTRWDDDEKRDVDVACVRIGDTLHFHPERWEQFKLALSKQSRDLARWADDGGHT